MAKQNNRYKMMDRYMTYALIADATLFVLYIEKGKGEIICIPLKH